MFITKQQIFDKVAAHLLQQNAQSVSGAQCMYRSPNGLMCAVGCLIDNEHYNPEFESLACTAMPVIDALRKSNIISDKDFKDRIEPKSTINMLRTIQNMHDSNDPIHWPNRLEAIALHYELEPYEGVKDADSTADIRPSV